MQLNFEDALSPAAYKIACAVWEACEADEFSDCTFDSFFPLVAAALRAAADQLREMYESEGCVHDPEELLDAIAAELDVM